jgi:hypothetical protein
MKFTHVLMAVLALGTSATAARPEEWRELRGQSFILRSRADSARLISLACDTEITANAFVGLVDPSDAPNGTLEVVAVDNDRDERELLPRFWESGGARPTGAYWDGPFGHHIVVRIDAKPAERLRRFTHEYTHYAVHLRHRDPPRWLDEGLAELWENAAIANDAVRLGGSVAEHARTLRGSASWIPIDTLTTAAELPRSERGVALFYAEAWALAHYLVVGPPQAKPLLEGSVELALPSDGQFRRYVAEGMGSTRRIPVDTRQGACGTGIIRRLSEVAGLTFRARALADGDRPAAARPLADRMLLLDPDSEVALETQGVIAFVGNRPTDAAVILDQLISTHRGSYLVYYYRALLAEPIPNLTDGSGPVPTIEYLRRVLALAPGFSPARERLKELGGLSD